ncbi:UNVERIFIED_CONTAM: hypothetical protein FKN15_003866 [Acipenser sinensis]
MDWNSSRDNCTSMGGHLVIIESEAEQRFLFDTAKAQTARNRYWMGLTDAVTEGVWLWVDGTTLNDKAQYWHGNEPDDWKEGEDSSGEDCARLAYSIDWDACLASPKDACLASPKDACLASPGVASRSRIAWGCQPLRIAWGCQPLRIAWGCQPLCIGWGCLLLRITLLLHTGYRVRGRNGAPTAASMARGSPPEFASRGSAAAAVASRGSAAAAVASRGSAAAAVASRGSAAAAVASRGSAAAAVASRGSAAAAVASRGSAAAAVASRGSAAAAVASRGSAAAAVASRGYEERGGGQETSSPSRISVAGNTVVGAPRRGNAGHEEGGEVRRPAPLAAVLLPEIVWSEPPGGEMPAMKNGGRSGDQLPQPHFRGRMECGGSPGRGSCRPRRIGGCWRFHHGHPPRNNLLPPLPGLRD